MESLLLGLAGGAAALALAKTINAMARDPVVAYALALVVTALLYVLFALLGRSPSGLGVETVGVALYGGCALLGLWYRAPLLVAAGWLLHPLWDLAMHLAGAGAAYTPAGYVTGCVGFDLVLAILIVPASTVRACADSSARRQSS